MDERIRMYFSFRSPYSWLASHRIGLLVTRERCAVEYIPVVPPARGLELSADKMAYLTEDVERIAGAYGLPVVWPDKIDTDWMAPHAAYLSARDAGRGCAFLSTLFAARFSRGEDVGTDTTLTRAAETAGLTPTSVVAAAHDRHFHRRVQKGMLQGRRDGLFGVPLFLFRGRKFWGNDRIEWLLREIQHSAGEDPPDLAQDPLQPPFTIHNR